jgi:excisionase family DNA binding protein
MSNHSIQSSIESIEAHIKFQSINSKEFLTLAEAAIFLGVSRSFLYKLTSGNKITFYRPTLKIIYFNKQELTDWVFQQKIEASQDTQQIVSRLNLDKK